jgi:hypothetical protein
MPLQSATTNEIPDEYRIGYEDAIRQAIQQTDERFAGMSIVASDWNENQYVASELVAQDWVTNNTRFGSTNPSEITFGDRSGFKQKCEWERILDKWDATLLEGLGDPTNAVLTAAAAGLKRKRDSIFIEALTADSIGGEFPHTTSYAFPAGNIIAVGDVPLQINAGGTTALGLTPGKIFAALREMEEDDVDLDSVSLFLAMGPRQKYDLIEYSQTYKNDVWAGMISAWLNNPGSKLFGCTPIITNRLAVSGSAVRTCVLFAREAMVTSPFMSKPYMSVRDDLKYSLQLANYGLWGAYRLYDEMVYQILCDEDTAASGTLATTY